jgi:filamentous hemagglutinin
LVVHNVKGGLRAPVNAAGGFKGRKGFELVNHPLQPVRSVATTINGRRFSSHALDQMQNRGIPPSVVQNAIEHGISSLGNKPGTQIFTDMVNKIRVVINSTTGNVITVIPGI